MYAIILQVEYEKFILREILIAPLWIWTVTNTVIPPLIIIWSIYSTFESTFTVWFVLYDNSLPSTLEIKPVFNFYSFYVLHVHES